jgi:hypothetical protein
MGRARRKKLETPRDSLNDQRKQWERPALRRLGDTEALRAVARILRERDKTEANERDKTEAKPRERRLPPLIRYPWPEKEPPSRFQRFTAWVRNR